ncbi:hypothetical protein WJX84_007446 [Apatococcus fuscideae]|uniref:Uncharacterized protein n=1 Tax=Apatococcus fuscideae TaxID=2026836 RepID=A0AAW1T608_9CHLO
MAIELIRQASVLPELWCLLNNPSDLSSCSWPTGSTFARRSRQAGNGCVTAHAHGYARLLSSSAAGC